MPENAGLETAETLRKGEAAPTAETVGTPQAAAVKNAPGAKKKPSNIDWKEDSRTLLVIVLVCLLQAIVLNGFYVPHQFLSGGVTGVAMLLNYLFGIPVWPVLIALNIPICIIGYKHLSAKLVFFSMAATIIFSLVLELTRGVNFGVDNPLLAAIAGASVLGITGAPVVRRDATLGGTDVIAAVLTRKYSIPMGTFSILFNLVIMSMLGIVRGIDLALVSMLAMFICNTAFNYALRGLNRTNTVFIISDKWDEIAPLVMNELHRGVTYIPAQGAYTGQPRRLVYCILRTVELAKIKHIVKDIDPHALFSIIETQEVLGRGFGSFN